MKDYLYTLGDLAPLLIPLLTLGGYLIYLAIKERKL